MAEQSSQYQLKPIQPVVTLLKHLRLIAVITIAGTFLLGIVVLVKVKPAYSAEAAIEVTLLHSRVLVWDPEKQFSSRTQYTDYVHTLVAYIVGYENVTRALKKVELPNAALQPGADDRETYLLLLPKLSAQAVVNTHLITVRVEDTQPHDLDILANALVDSIIEQSLDERVGGTDSRLRYLGNDLKQKQKELSDRYAMLERLTRELGTFDFSDDNNPHDLNLTFLRNSLNDIQLERIEARQGLAALEETAEARRDLGLEPHIAEFVYQDLNTVEMKNLTFRLREELNRQGTTIKADHPSSKRLREYADNSQSYLDEALERSREKAAEIFYGKLNIDQQVTLAQASSNLEAKLKIESEILARVEEEQRLLVETTPHFLHAMQIKGEIKRLEERIGTIEGRIQDLELEGKAPSRLRVQSSAMPAGFPNRDRRKVFLVLAMFFSFFTAVLLAFAIDFLDRRLIDPSYITHVIGAPPTLVLPHREGLADFGQLLRAAPESYHADQLRRMMPRVFSSQQGRGPRRFTLVAISGGAGSSSIALCCMTHLQKIGRKAGLLEITSSAGGLSERTADWGLSPGTLPLPGSLAEDFPLSLRSGGGMEHYHFERPSGKEMLADPERLESLLDCLAGRSGCLLIDSPPLLKHAEAELLCKLADVVVLVASGPRNTADELKRTMTLLERLGVQNCAVVANDLPVLPGSHLSRSIAAFSGTSAKSSLPRDVITAVQKAIKLS